MDSGGGSIITDMRHGVEGGSEDLARFLSFLGFFLESTEPGHEEMLIHIHTHNTAYSLSLHDSEASRTVTCRRTDGGAKEGQHSAGFTDDRLAPVMYVQRRASLWPSLTTCGGQ